MKVKDYVPVVMSAVEELRQKGLTHCTAYDVLKQMDSRDVDPLRAPYGDAWGRGAGRFYSPACFVTRAMKAAGLRFKYKTMHRSGGVVPGSPVTALYRI
jgi:hypothetical protein